MARHSISKVVDISSSRIRDNVTQSDAVNPGLAVEDNARADGNLHCHRDGRRSWLIRDTT